MLLVKLKSFFERPLLDLKGNYFNWPDALIERLQPTFRAGHYSSNMNFSLHIRTDI